MSATENLNLQTDEKIEVPAINEADAEKCDDNTGYSISNEDLFKNLLLQANHAAHEAETKLQVEESGNKIADLQGFCAGIRNFKSVAKSAGFDIPPTIFDTANRMTPWVQVAENQDGDTTCDLALSLLRIFLTQLDLLAKTKEYEALGAGIQAETNSKKNWLFNEAKSGRDLYWVRGWKRGFSWVSSQIGELRLHLNIKETQAKKKAQEKASSLPFDDEDEEV